MKRIFHLSFFLFAALWLAGCAALERASDPEVALGELPASFQGELPCADCAGIRYRLSLFPDGVYTLKTDYLGEGERRRFHEQGQWSLDGAGRTLTLAGGDQGPRQWRVQDARTLEMLDLEGRRIDSELDYRLKRTEAFVTESLENTYWKLIELDGAPVPAVDAGREPHLVFHPSEGRVAGATGCNRLTGSYQRDASTLSFGALASTRMACADAMRLESRFLAMLERVDRYRVLADRLEFYDARGEVLARFEVRHLT
ncbi:META domain-containing protein [Halomonas koreensis]|uniref:META domain-containing protein n=1 Tax=Halomonas koreensis TaxID=245385 RepID=A0ABU1G187_9GAMM|nr:META domain-containing protein [Halomonas koreensis]MDR5866702.1 META domain-containing protein [Halomonas koreensis]